MNHITVSGACDVDDAVKLDQRRIIIAEVVCTMEGKKSTASAGRMPVRTLKLMDAIFLDGADADVYFEEFAQRRHDRDQITGQTTIDEVA